MEEAILQYITPEVLSEGNQYFCEVCQKKVDALKGVKIKSLPDILQISLNRFEFDFVTFDRKKVTDRFEFGLELDLSPYTEVESEGCVYEL